jgi:hypothetical protein
MKGENAVLGAVLGATVMGALALLFRRVRRKAHSTETLEGLSPDEALSGPTQGKPSPPFSRQQLDDMHRLLDEMERSEATAIAETVLGPPNRKVVALPPWRFQRLAGVPAPQVIDARRLDKLPAADIRHALHHAYAGDLQPAKRLHAQLRPRAERAVAPLRESAVGALEDMYVLHPNADFGDDVIDV